MSMDGVRALVQEGRTLEAIRLYREQSGANLNDALAVVDGLQQQLGSDEGVAPQADRSLETPGILEGPDVTALLQAGRKLDAIRVYREQTGTNLKDATQTIKDLEHRLDRADPSEIEHDQDAATLLRAGRKIDAIRVYREQHGISLKDATAAITQMEKELGLRG